VEVLGGQSRFSTEAQPRFKRYQPQQAGRVGAQLGEGIEVMLHPRRFALAEPQFQVDARQLDEGSLAKPTLRRQPRAEVWPPPALPGDLEAVTQRIHQGFVAGTIARTHARLRTRSHPISYTNLRTMSGSSR